VSPPGIGLDVLEIERLEAALERRPRLAERVFSPAEIEFAQRRKRPGRHLAARFAAKEAALKCLGIGGLRLHEVEVAGGGRDVPHLVLSGSALEVATRHELALSLSLSHSEAIAAAVVVARDA
jgi:holo-[acyl-carrier protein] synthase